MLAARAYYGFIPSFELHWENAPAGGGPAVLRVCGELDLNRARETEAALTDFAESAETGLLVDLRECEFIDSSGLRSLLIGHQALTTSNGESGGQSRLAVIVEPDSQVGRLLDLVGLEEHFMVTTSREEALRLLTNSTR